MAVAGKIIANIIPYLLAFPSYLDYSLSNFSGVPDMI